MINVTESDRKIVDLKPKHLFIKKNYNRKRRKQNNASILA